MMPEQFIYLWKDNKLTERNGAQAHFDDLCDLLGVDKLRNSDNYYNTQQRKACVNCCRITIPP